MHRVDSRFVPAGFKYLCYGGDAEERAWQTELAFWDRALVECGGPFFGGAEMGLADVALAPFAERLEAALSVHRRQGLRDACREGQLGALERWLDLLWEVPAFAATRCESAEAIEACTSRWPFAACPTSTNDEAGKRNKCFSRGEMAVTKHFKLVQRRCTLMTWRARTREGFL